MFCLLLSGCSKEEVLEKYNAVVEKVGEVQLTNDINLQGKRDYGEDYYTGTYQAEYKKFSDTEYLFGGTTIERAAGKQVELFCNLEITKGEAEIFIISGSNEPKTLIKTTGTYENTITLPDELEREEKEHCRKVTGKILGVILIAAGCCTTLGMKKYISLIALTALTVFISQCIGIIKYKVEKEKN